MRRSAKPEVTPSAIAKYAKQRAAVVKKLQQRHSRHHPMVSTRTAEYRGHKIIVRTTYEISVDGRAVHGHLGVDNSGQVHYHPIPNVAFDSAIDLVKRIIDVFPDEFSHGGDSGGGHHAVRRSARTTRGTKRGAVVKRTARKARRR